MYTYVYKCFLIILELGMLGQRVYQSAQVGYAAVTNNSKNIKTTKVYFPFILHIHLCYAYVFSHWDQDRWNIHHFNH